MTDNAIYRPRQRGAVLVVSLIFLLLVTLIAAASVNTTVMEEQMAANRQYKTTSYQLAESAIQRSWNGVVLNKVFSYATDGYRFSQDYNGEFDPPTSAIANTPTLAAARITYCGERTADGDDNNSDLSHGEGGFALRVFDVDGRGEIAAINAVTLNRRRGAGRGPNVDIRPCPSSF